MGRGKVEVKMMENEHNREVTFAKRKAGMFKKANELSILCEAEIAVILFSADGKLFEFASSSSSMKNILSRYAKGLEWKENPESVLPPTPENWRPNRTDAVKSEMEKHESKQMQMLGKDITSISMMELFALEQQINDALLCIKERKEKLLSQQVDESRKQEQCAMLKNEALQKQIEEYQSHLGSSGYQAQLCIGYPLSSNPPVEEGSQSLETAHNSYQPQIYIRCPSSSNTTPFETSLSPETPNNSGLPDEGVNTLLVLG